MPCRALEAFRRVAKPLNRRHHFVRLNALSGIGGVQTEEWADLERALNELES